MYCWGIVLGGKCGNEVLNKFLFYCLNKMMWILLIRNVFVGVWWGNCKCVGFVSN